MSLPTPKPKEVIYEDDKLYLALARYPMHKGHCVAVWKDAVEDIHLLNRDEYEHLMNVIEDLHDAMLAVLQVEKVYLLYLDEAKHVHWHLVPRYEEKGLISLEGKHPENNDFSIVSKLQAELQKQDKR